MARILNFIIIIYALETLSGCGFSESSDYTTFRNHMQSEVDPSEVQKWAIPILKEYKSKYPNGDGIMEIDIGRLPNSIKQLRPSPEWINLAQQNGQNEPSIGIVWGGGFQHWGLYVGDKSLQVSNSDAVLYTPWIKGVFLFEQIK